ncbi:WhiB family transcriptional regulator [Streptomyces stelliscabiei]|uniref:WhiB family transcriptional regulator n=1 Tax=Streptomyces stelliscabiei TaxID=146820 RepID=UPI0029B5B89A|nr:WhiB family transcriptional regulator [Streptomyces stelliscabiei]MDX2515875.1 WhiB family transcriptional regulator [Streptomyces stelliscabiei]MDX2549454.1 WhiB family transcriptional regulator [Streptomyces stelliscabiei]MDX2611476.1 WhiB family transcriptional regulator [Streptomyces stelliscabiei]MDX2634428.1 WhiB family transcriptional regulator [Streptomyces stelliscabiei]MDX2659374.1 WhiB family transcriptional regulator [Streptomyces stelliscabiei]
MRTITTNDTARPTLRGIADHSWHARGLCHGMPAEDADELFFHAPRDHEAAAEAKSICGRCPVKKDCFNYALDNDIRHGMWGGLTEIERRPWHARVSKRLDYARVKAAFQGRDVHLSDAEREAVVRHAYVRGWSPERLAYTLQLELDWARDLMRRAAHAVADRDRYWGLYDETAPTADEDEDEDEAISSSVPRQVQTRALITALGKAA